MSQLPQALALTEEDLKLMLACQVHLGTKNCDSNMERYVWKRRSEDGIHIIDLRKTWEKLILAARVIAAVENPQDVSVVAVQGQGTPYAQRAVLKFANHVGTHAIAGRFTPGTFTNYIQAKYVEPRLLVVTDPGKDHQPLTEASYVNCPVIAFVDTDSNLRHVDIAIPCNNKGKYSIAVMYWLLAREVLRLRDSIPRNQPWEVLVDMFIYPDPEEVEKQEEQLQNQQQQSGQQFDGFDNSQALFTSTGQGNAGDWNEDDGVWDPSVVASGNVPTSGGPEPQWED